MWQVEVTKYEELEEAAAELKLKHLLWDSLNQWDIVIYEWMQVYIHQRQLFLIYNYSLQLYLIGFV